MSAWVLGEGDRGVCSDGRRLAMARRAFLLIALAACVFLLFGCQTVQGLGEDIQWTGEKGAEIVGQ